VPATGQQRPQLHQLSSDRPVRAGFLLLAGAIAARQTCGCIISPHLAWFEYVFMLLLPAKHDIKKLWLSVCAPQGLADQVTQFPGDTIAGEFLLPFFLGFSRRSGRKP
jgi:hypothetical protein